MEAEAPCILLAEDDPVIRLAAVRTLSKFGYCLLETRDGAEALQLANERTDRIDLLITNVHMPRMEGHELARLIRQKRPTIKVLIVSSQNEADFPREVYHDYALLKPVSAESLARTVKHLLSDVN